MWLRAILRDERGDVGLLKAGFFNGLKSEGNEFPAEHDKEEKNQPPSKKPGKVE